jgi:uncharacterized protein YkwD
MQMKRAAQFIFMVLITGVFISTLSCTPPSTEAPPAPPPAAPSAAPSAPVQKQGIRISVHKLEQQVHERVNKERRKRGLPTMRWDAALGSIAGKHSKDMSVKQYFGHTSPDGQGYSDRYLKSGYACGLTVNGVLRRGAENIYRYSPSAGEDPAEAIIRGWLKNNDDRKNLLSLPWDREGAGVSIGPDGVLYVTMNFC